MNWDEVTGNWKPFKGNIKEKWGKVASNDRGIVAGKCVQIHDQIPVRRSIKFEETAKELKDWEVLK